MMSTNEISRCLPHLVCIDNVEIPVISCGNKVTGAAGFDIEGRQLVQTQGIQTLGEDTLHEPILPKETFPMGAQIMLRSQWRKWGETGDGSTDGHTGWCREWTGKTKGP